MSLVGSPDFQVRPEENGVDMLFPTEEPLTNSFDDYLNENYEYSDGDNKDSFDNFLDFFEKEARAAGGGYLSPVSGPTKQEASSPHPWRKGLWCLNQNGASLPSKVVQEKSNTAQHPSSPKVSTSHSFTQGNKESTKYKSQNGEEKSAGSTDILSRRYTIAKIINFHLLPRDEAEVLSSPPLDRPLQPQFLAQVNAANVARNGADAHIQALRRPIAVADIPYPSVEQGNAITDAPLDSHFYSGRTNGVLSPYEQPHSSADYLHDPHDQANAGWTAESLHSPIISEYRYDSQAGYSYLGEMQPGWPQSSNSASQPDAPGSYQEQTSIIAAPTPHRPTHQLLQNPLSPQLGGLGFHYSGIEPAVADRQSHVLSPLEPAYSYPPLPELAPEPIPTFADESRFTTPRHHQRTNLTPSRSTSPSISPTNTRHNYAATSRSLRQTSPTRQSARRKSIGAPKASSFPNCHQSSGSTSKPPRTPRTPKTPTGGGFGAIDFVNFTPKDSMKLLNDVAPSGSSKTRARREQEARDRRRRLSEAAVRAVRRAAKAAGGDVDNGEVEALERAILA